MKVAGKVIKWANLVSLSTITQMVDLLCELGILVIKSIEMYSHTWFGKGKGCRSPYGFCVEYLSY